jgi:hypothetical protein
MKKNLYYLLILVAPIFLMPSCRKDRAHEDYQEQPPFIKPDFTIKVNSSVAGFVTDESNNPVFGAVVIGGNKQTTTDEYGYFQINNTSVSEAAGLVKISKPGYFDSYKTFTPIINEESFVRTKLLLKVNAGTIDAASGGTVTATNNTTIVLPANAVSLASNGNAYAGVVNIAVKWIDPTDIAMQQLVSPGDGRGLDTDGHLTLIKSFGAIAVELTGSGGQLLQIATGKKATISIPVPTAMTATSPASIPLWSFDEIRGLWKQEGTATKSGSVYSGEVSHFSFWSGAVGLPLVNFTVQIVDAALNPLSHVAVGIRFAGQSFNAGGGTFSFTDVNGVVSGAVPANTSLVLSVLTTCALESYSHSFTTTNSAVDLGTITGNMGQGLVTISGSVINCNNQPVTNGYIQTFDNGFFNRVAIVNGTFSFTAIACTNMVTNLVAVDNDANQQSAVQALSLVTGSNNTGLISACGTSTVGVINYTIDGVSKTLVEPTNSLNAYFTPIGGGWTTILDLVSSGNSNITFQFNGDATIGNAHTVNDIFSPGFAIDERAIAPVPLTVTITEFGNPGGFVSGQFSGPVLGFPSNAPHTISCDFRVRRYQ